MAGEDALRRPERSGRREEGEQPLCVLGINRMGQEDQDAQETDRIHRHTGASGQSHHLKGPGRGEDEP